MSQENVEVVRADVRAFTDRGAWRRGEYDQVFLEYCSADYELIPPPSYPDAATSYRGLEGVRGWQRLMDEIWVDWDSFRGALLRCRRPGSGVRPHTGDRQAKAGADRDPRRACLDVA